ncbi:hypothetical protein AB0K61_25910, partial [Streptomyces syringium]|uniref:hypothetical protein n=1 Tax=Streptomyces syringium TaxID=76729 RepID=UPI00343083D4
MVSQPGSSGGQDPVALIEIDLYGELMIAASSVDEERLSPDRIDEVLRVVPRGTRGDAKLGSFVGQGFANGIESE